MMLCFYTATRLPLLINFFIGEHLKLNNSILVKEQAVCNNIVSIIIVILG